MESVSPVTLPAARPIALETLEDKRASCHRALQRMITTMSALDGLTRPRLDEINQLAQEAIKLSQPDESLSLELPRTTDNALAMVGDDLLRITNLACRIIEGHLGDPTYSFRLPKETMAVLASEEQGVDPFHVIKALGNGIGGSVSEVEVNGSHYALKIPSSSRAREEMEKGFMWTLGLSRKYVPEISYIGSRGELMELGNSPLYQLFSRESKAIVGEKRRANLPKLPLIIMEILQTLEESHSKGIVHCDIKPANIVLFGDHVKLIDWDFAEVFPNKVIMRGSASYMSPEVVARKEAIATYSKRDMWALGSSLMELIAGYCNPFRQRVYGQYSEEATLQFIENLRRYPDWTTEIAIPAYTTFEDWKEPMLMLAESILALQLEKQGKTKADVQEEGWNEAKEALIVNYEGRVVNLLKGLLQVDPSKRLSAREAIALMSMDAFLQHQVDTLIAKGAPVSADAKASLAILPDSEERGSHSDLI
ncbi:MAG: protein kinase [Chlamydiales bacterium]|nr:protein kinase [Chlamydiales bacterium]